MKPKTFIFLLFILVMTAQIILLWDITNLFIKLPTAMVTGIFFGRWAGIQK